MGVPARSPKPRAPFPGTSWWLPPALHCCGTDVTELALETEVSVSPTSQFGRRQGQSGSQSSGHRDKRKKSTSVQVGKRTGRRASGTGSSSDDKGRTPSPSDQGACRHHWHLGCPRTPATHARCHPGLMQALLHPETLGNLPKVTPELQTQPGSGAPRPPCRVLLLALACPLPSVLCMGRVTTDSVAYRYLYPVENIYFYVFLVNDIEPCGCDLRLRGCHCSFW